MTTDRFSPGEIWLDEQGEAINVHGGGILRHEGIYYWFGEHKTEGTLGNTAQVGVRVYSSTDLYRWKNEGVALAVSETPGDEIEKGCVLERPKVLFNRRTSKFVMWFHLEFKGRDYRDARSGVAVADSVTGPYRFLGSFRPNAGIWPENYPVEKRQPITPEETIHLEKLRAENPEGDYRDLVLKRDFAGGQMARDMTLFLDDDENAYHLFASEENGTFHISLLSEDFLSPAGKYVRLFPGRFHEAPALWKTRGKYYLITSGCTGWAPNAARLSVAENIWGPWKELGNPCLGAPDEIARTFETQSTHILPVAGKPDAFIFMADRWNPENAIDGRHVWLPLEWEGDRPALRWHASWSLSFFDGSGDRA